MKREEVSMICKALSDINRLHIIEMLTKGERCACDLLKQLNVTQPTLSHHMKVLSDCGLVHSRKEGKWHHYAINCCKFATFKDFLNATACCESIADKRTHRN